MLGVVDCKKGNTFSQEPNECIGKEEDENAAAKAKTQ